MSMKVKHVPIKKGDLEGSVPEESLETWVRHGWTAVDDGSSESGEEPVAHNEGGDQ